MMARAQQIAATAILLLIAATAIGAGPQTSPGYNLHPGDELLVGVFDDPKLVPQKIIIAPDGTFSYPLIGRVVTSGKTADQVRVEMEDRLKKYIADPSVMVIINDVKGNVAYVVGQVNKPGDIVMNPTVNVLQALSIAGGLNPYAKGDSIIVIRSTSYGQSVSSFRYGQVISGRNLEQNIQLQSGDVVVVP